MTMPEYRITIKYEGYKTFEIDADCFDQALQKANDGPEHITNEIEDTVTETVVSIELIEETR